MQPKGRMEVPHKPFALAEPQLYLNSNLLQDFSSNQKVYFLHKVINSFQTGKNKQMHPHSDSTRDFFPDILFRKAIVLAEQCNCLWLPALPSRQWGMAELKDQGKGGDRNKCHRTAADIIKSAGACFSDGYSEALIVRKSQQCLYIKQERFL